MINKIIFPTGCSFNPTQRIKITDVWADPPIGLQLMTGEFPHLEAKPYGNKWKGAVDARWITLSPGEEYKDRGANIIVNPSLNSPDRKYNERISPEEVAVSIQEVQLGVGETRVPRYVLSTRVTPKNGSMAYHAIVNVPIKCLDDIPIGRMWATEALIQKEREMRESANRYTFF